MKIYRLYCALCPFFTLYKPLCLYSLTLTHTHTYAHTHTHTHTHTHSLILPPTSINGDHIPDLFATTCNSGAPHTPTFFISTIRDDSFKFTRHSLNPSPTPDITNSYFVDLDSDCLPELVLYREANRSIEVWKEREESFIMVSNQSLPSVFSRDSMKVIGLPTFADMGEPIL